jgi:hypothetical protein
MDNSLHDSFRASCIASFERRLALRFAGRSPGLKRLDLPDPNGVVARSGTEPGPVGAEGQRKDIISMPLQPGPLIARRGIPNANAAIAAARGHPRAVGMKDRCEDLSSMAQ